MSCSQVLSIEWSLYMPLSILLQEEEEVPDDFAEDLPRGEQPIPKVEMERTSVLDLSPPVPPPTAQLLLRLMSHPPHHSRHQSISLSVLGSYLMFWMLSTHLLLIRHRWPSGWPQPRSLSRRIKPCFFRFRATSVSRQST